MEDLIRKSRSAMHNARSLHYLLIQPSTLRIQQRNPIIFERSVKLALEHLDNDVFLENFREFLQRESRPDSVTILREKAQQLGLVNYSRMSKEQLIAALEANGNGKSYLKSH